MTTTPQPLRTADQGAADAVTMLRGELGRSDSKASLLLALTGAALAGIGSAAPSWIHLPAAAVTVGVVGALAFFAATVILLLAVRPTLAGTGWPTWHKLTDTELEARLADGARMDEVRVLQAAARSKFARVQYAIGCALVGAGCLAVAAVLAAAL
ncbi:Pycsar system effector family protein [Streptomyces mobaraensis]|uniref:Pycsar effector protein domain-containing protein n=1 Tax=Streptomyces mobaraensis TaxID=35621 RepID=A0A5N5VXK1_STRMB|nr:Pycsar system effector family protein [Streptomyces mobaraensis]KAB7833534.1 hypothetical protein FRZ00_33340 [Streptomyces mobaraensis]